MKLTLVRSFLDREVELDGKRYVFRSPKVSEALRVIASSKGASAGEEVQKEILFEALSGWLPKDLYDVFNKSDYPVDRVVVFVLAIVNEGVPEFKLDKRLLPKKKKDSASPVESTEASGVDWEDVIAEYMATYGCSFADVLDEPWNSFLLMSRKTDMIAARETLRMMSVKGLPYIKDDKERQFEMDKLIIRAGGFVKSDEERREDILAKQQSQLDVLAAQFSKAGMFVGNEKAEA